MSTAARMSPKHLRQQFEDNVKASVAKRAEVRALVREKRWREADDRDRVVAYTQRTVLSHLPAGGPEGLIGATVDFQGASFLTEGASIRRAVAYVEVNDTRYSEVGSGFLISPRLFLTCAHVISDVNAAHSAQITFDREMDDQRRPLPTTTYTLDPDTFALFSAEDELDYAVIAVGSLASGSARLDSLPNCPLSNTPDRHVLGMNVNIIQHPRGWPKMIAVRNNILTFRTPLTLLYETDTEQGSSGSPVFNDDWDLVALHHWGGPYLEQKDEFGHDIPSNVNEGVRISAIYNNLKARLDSLPGPQRRLLEEALAIGDAPSQANSGKVLSQPHPSPDSEAMIKEQGGYVNSKTTEARLTIPLEVTVRLASSATTSAAAAVAPALAPPAEGVKTLIRGAEAKKLDKDYSNRSGYDPQFITGATIPLPKPSTTLAKQIAPLRAEEEDAEKGELKYEHFSVKMNKGKRIAIFTATNIDGETYLTVDRNTGQVVSEGETWYKDPRISNSFYLDQTFYSDWSSYFDRGHLTRRSDPTWGTADEAERANADTFHFTNCSPQHFRFNQSAKFWQGVERYVLENGLFTAETRKRLVVLQGPIFDDKIDLWSDDVQIPSSFFKIVVWKGQSSLKAVGMVVDQLALLSESRTYIGQPQDLPSVNVTHWIVAIPKIEERTGLDFGKAVRDADTVATGQQPLVGSEAARIIRSLRDLDNFVK